MSLKNCRRIAYTFALLRYQWRHTWFWKSIGEVEVSKDKWQSNGRTKWLLKEKEVQSGPCFLTYKFNWNTSEIEETSKFGEFISPAEVALACLKFILSL